MYSVLTDKVMGEREIYGDPLPPKNPLLETALSYESYQSKTNENYFKINCLFHSESKKQT